MLVSVGFVTLLLAPAPTARDAAGCEPQKVTAPRRRPPLEADTALPHTDDPLGGFLPATAGQIRLEPQRVPLAELPEGASQELVTRALEGVGRLRRLELQRTGLTSLEPLRQLDGLDVFLAYDTAVSDLAPVAHLTQLRELDLRSTGVVDIRPLAGMHGLKLLALDDTGVKDVRPLLGLRCLEVLSLNAAPVTSLHNVSRLKRLRYLSVADTLMTNVRSLGKAVELRELVLDRTKIVDLRPLVHLKKLRKLSLRGTPVSNVRPLMRMPHLEEIDLRETDISIPDMDALIDALPYTTIHTNVYQEEIERLTALQEQTQRAMHIFAEAESLWGTSDRRREALDLAREARLQLEQVGDFAQGERTVVATWLAARGASDR